MGYIPLKETLASKPTIIFDLFHTLTAPEIVMPGSLSTSEILGIDAVKWNRQLMENSKNRLRGFEKDPEEIIGNLARAIDPFISDGLIVGAAQHRVNRFEVALKQMPAESVQAIQSLKKSGKTIALVSNADVIESAFWNQSPVASFFDEVVFSCDVGYLKPEVEIYNICLQRLNKEPKDCIFVGDGGSDEFVGARQAGLTCVMVTGIAEKIWPEKLESIKPQADFIIQSLFELL